MSKEELEFMQAQLKIAAKAIMEARSVIPFNFDSWSDEYFLFHNLENASENLEEESYRVTEMLKEVA